MEKEMKMEKLQEWINERIEEISKRLPKQVHEDPASFACGYNIGYKQAVLDLQNFIVHEEKYL